MKLRHILAAVFVIGMSALCVRLGFWQLSRLREKQALNVALRSALARPPVRVTDPATDARSVGGRRVEITGIYDEDRQFLLSGRAQAGSPGVSVVTPLVFAGGTHAVLVERGWLYSDDAARAHPERFPEPGARRVIGVAEALLAGRGGPPLMAVRSDSATLWSTRWLDYDSLAARLPYALAGFYVKQLPALDLPPMPVRREPVPYDEAMHMGYAMQWFLFATILSVGSLVLARTRRRRSDLMVPPPPGDSRGG